MRRLGKVSDPKSSSMMNLQLLKLELPAEDL